MKKKIRHAYLRNLNPLYSSVIINKCICSTFLLHTSTRNRQIYICSIELWTACKFLFLCVYHLL